MAVMGDRVEARPAAPGSTRSYDWLAHHAAVRPDKVALVDLATSRSLTYRELDERTRRLALALRRRFGVERGDRVAVLAHNDTSVLEVQFACWKLGCIFVPLNWRLALPELEYIVGDCAPRVLVSDGDFADAAKSLAGTCGVEHLVSWRDGAHGFADYEELLAAEAPDLVAVPATHDTVVTILYTSGTTGHPKGALITQGMLTWHAVNVVEYLGIGADTVGLVGNPLFHTGGLNCFTNPTIHFGGTSLVMRRFDGAEAVRLLSDPGLGITLFSGVPTMWLTMSQAPGFADAAFPTLATAGIGGAPSPLPLLETWAAKGVVLQQVYGMTETCPSTTIATREAALAKLGSAGTPTLHTEVRVVDATGADCPAGQTGELWVRGPCVTPGYWNLPAATDEAFVDGFLRTGDAAYRDPDGYVYVVDRWKDMYISGGENVYPSEVESVLYQLPEIAEVAVFGVPDDRWGEVGRAAIVLKAGTTLEPDAITRHCVARLAKYKVPRSYEFVAELPHNAAGKLLKRELRRAHGA